MRCFFHVMAPNDVVLDVTGIDVPDIAEAWAQAALAVSEFFVEEDIDDGEGWEGWTLEAFDGSGNPLFSMPIVRQVTVRYVRYPATDAQAPSMFH